MISHPANELCVCAPIMYPSQSDHWRQWANEFVSVTKIPEILSLDVPRSAWTLVVTTLSLNTNDFETNPDGWGTK